MPWNRRNESFVRLALLVFLMPSAVALADLNDEIEDGSGQAAVKISQQDVAPAEKTGDEDDGLPPGVVHQDHAAAIAQDANLMATQGGLPLSDVESSLAFQDAFTMYGTEILLPRYEDQISAIWVDPTPATRGYVRFVAEVPELASSEAARRGLDVVFTGGSEISMAEHAQRSELVADVLVFNGYQNFISGPDHKSGLIEIEIRLPRGSPELHVEELAVLIQKYATKF